MRILARLALLGIGLTLGAPAGAGSCFCLLDADRTPFYDCVEGYEGSARSPYVECRLEAGPTRTRIAGAAGMRRVAGGEPPCEPCEVRAASRDRHIRNGEDDAVGTARGTGDE